MVMLCKAKWLPSRSGQVVAITLRPSGCHSAQANDLLYSSILAGEVGVPRGANQNGHAV